MSTRATYLFKGNDRWRPDICVYIHHDGYPEGGAGYFWDAFKQEGRLDVESFIRANERAEITGSNHDAHGDTQYHYTLEGNTLTVDAAGISESHGRVFIGKWWEFINRYGCTPNSPIDDWEVIAPYDITGYGCMRPMIASQIMKKLDEELKTEKIWIKNGHTKGANMDHLQANIKRLREAIDASQVTVAA